MFDRLLQPLYLPPGQAHQMSKDSAKRDIFLFLNDKFTRNVSSYNIHKLNNLSMATQQPLHEKSTKQIKLYTIIIWEILYEDGK